MDEIKETAQQKYYRIHREECCKRVRDYRLKNRVKVRMGYKKSYELHKDACLRSARNWKERHKEEVRIWRKKYNKEHKKQRAEYGKKWYKEHPDKRLKYNKERYLDRPWMPYFYGARYRCNKKGFKNYESKGIKFLMTREDFKNLWFRDKACLMKRPSIDRKDSKGHYILENCRFIELRDNQLEGIKNRWK